MKEKIKSYIFIVIISIIVSIPLYKTDFNILIDDGIQHVCRIMGTYQSITEGQTFPLIMSNFCNDFGYSWNIFYSPITAYVPLLFRLITDSYINCLKAFILLLTILTGISMYECVYKITKNRLIGLLASTIYIFAPYRLTDIYKRVAIAEVASFIFLPMIFQGAYTIFDDEETGKKKSGLLLIFGATGLILTHTVIAMYTAIFGFLYVIINIKKLKDKNIIKKLLIILIFTISITSFFWAPMLEHKLNTEYEVFKEGRMERSIYYELDLLDLVYTEHGTRTYQIGLVTIIGIVLTLLAFKKIDKRYKKIYILSLVAGIFSIIMAMKWFPFERLPSILKLLQFPYRMLEFSSFFLAIVASINYGILIKNFRARDVLVLSCIIILLVVPLKNNIEYKEVKEDKLWPAVPVSQYTGRVHAGCATFEYLPSKAFENLNYVKTREDRVYVLQGESSIYNEQKNGCNMSFDISNVKEGTILELPYIYYLGYSVTLKETDKTSIKLKIEESKNGFIQIQINKDITAGEIEVKYEGSLIMKISMCVSILSFTLLMIYYLKTLEKNENAKTEVVTE